MERGLTRVPPPPRPNRVTNPPSVLHSSIASAGGGPARAVLTCPDSTCCPHRDESHAVSGWNAPGLRAFLKQLFLAACGRCMGVDQLAGGANSRVHDGCICCYYYYMLKCG